VTDRPYTDEDLRTEAARQMLLSVEDPDFMGIGERMEWAPIPSRPDDHWDDLDREDFDKAQRAIDDLLGKAADVSEWAIGLGADGLEPSDEHVITLSGDDKQIARIHFAFEPGMDDDMRTALVQGIGQTLDAHLS
jgi:hypothetical protein